jgi:enoyl-CoA hydratase/carnithine racemase
MKDGGAFNADSLAAFCAALDTVLAREDAEVLLITGEGKNFSQGLDLEYLGGIGASDPDAALGFVWDCMRMVGRLLCYPLPVVSLVNGHAFGLGAMITLASDYKVMREDRGYFCLPEIDLGMTLTWRMNALVCGKLQGNALRDVLLTGKRLGGPEAQALGVVDYAGSEEMLRGEALALCAPMRGKNRAALAGLKRGVNTHILAVIESDDPDATIPLG